MFTTRQSTDPLKLREDDVGKIDTFQSSSDYVFRSIPLIYPTGFVVLMNCWFRTWGEPPTPYLDQQAAFLKWKTQRLEKSSLPENHPFFHEVDGLQVGECLIYQTDNCNDAMMVYDFFGDPDYYYVTFWENGKIIHENT